LVAPVAEVSLALKRADRALEAAAEVEEKAREEWSKAAAAAKRYEAALYAKYRATMRGIELATPAECEELKRLQDVVTERFEVYQARARETVAKRQAQAAETHRDLQAQIEAWGAGA
jgi:hypothetical protein